MNQNNSEPCELAEVIYEKPLSGAFVEMSFGSDKGNTLWVKFSDKDGINEWIGKFADHSGGVRRVIKAAEPDIFFVSAGCFIYLVDATNRKILNHFYGDQVCEGIYDQQSKCFIVADYVRLRLIESGKTIWASKRIALDGIRDLKIEGRTVSGLAYVGYVGFKGEEEKFTLDLDTRAVRCDVDLSSWDDVLQKPHKKIPWWKFW